MPWTKTKKPLHFCCCCNKHFIYRPPPPPLGRPSPLPPRDNNNKKSNPPPPHHHHHHRHPKLNTTKKRELAFCFCFLVLRSQHLCRLVGVRLAVTGTVLKNFTLKDPSYVHLGLEFRRPSGKGTQITHNSSRIIRLLNVTTHNERKRKSVQLRPPTPQKNIKK